LKRIFIALIACLGAAWIVAGAQAQGPGYPVPRPPECDKATAKMSLARADFDGPNRMVSILAPITRLASGFARVELLGGGRITEFNVQINTARGRIRTTRGIDQLQARASTAILTLRYSGDDDTRAQTLRLRAAKRAAKLSSRRPTISTSGQLDAAGAITRSAVGVVRVQLEWVDKTTGQLIVVERQARIRNGRWGVRYQLPSGVIAQINNRCTTVHSYVLFTGYQPRFMRGEMVAYQVMPAPPS
jgi:hypothetical protein